MRSAIIKSLERLVSISKESLNEVNEICMSLQAIVQDLIADTHDDNQQALIQILLSLC